ncbi:MAG: 5-amino-6-(D-ribitylamino)uracil--L-tyrosine 4-hydroxyphenyl transferase CofH, partial [Gammaproteobacteria bacterium]|nr:5-amino-6-(D-ribitylamino)uracil--L-tyrosine 4-hydroxyphenyl transferase CofH [Gammaproteobacteria bacterium]
MPTLSRAHALVEHAARGVRLSDEEALSLAGFESLSVLMPAAAALRDAHFGDRISFSKKVFIPLTRLCRDVCHYCTFATTPRQLQAPFLSIDEVVAIAAAGRDAGCVEALFTLGDKPELRYRAARDALNEMGFSSTLEYLAAAADAVLQRTGLLPHLNPGVMDTGEIELLRKRSVSMGIMLESASPRLAERGGPHFGSPDKDPAVRIRCMHDAGELKVPFTTGILIGIGETRVERIQALLEIRRLHEAHGHIQEVIVQNFRAKPDTLMADASEPTPEDHLWTLAVARLVLGGQMNIQAPPNLQPGMLRQLVEAGINDWGGVSPVTPDHVNPEAPWPHLRDLAEQTRECGKILVQRLALYPEFARDADRWVDPALVGPLLANSDSRGLARDCAWAPGDGAAPVVELTTFTEPASGGHTGPRPVSPADQELDRILDRASCGHELDEQDIVRLFDAREDRLQRVCAAADELRRVVVGDTISYVVNRNINYTNICYFRCRFCAFSKGKLSENLRGRPYDLALEEVARRTVEAWERGATEVCMQGGIHPEYTGETYLQILSTVKQAVPEMHVHAFSPLEVWQGAKTLNMPLREYLQRLKDAGLGSLPGTAAEILDDEVRAIICPDKLKTAQWLEVMGVAHEVGLPSTSTIMFGHVDHPWHWARHLLHIRRLAARTGGFTEFVPLPFVGAEAPIFLRGGARRGPTLRESVLMHAVSRLVLHPHIKNIQTSWVKLGREGVALCLNSGANDLGGTLMN